MEADGFADRESLAMRVVDLAKALVLADGHFLASAVGRMPMTPGSHCASFATDGTMLGIDPERICNAFAQTGEAPRHDFLHAVLHCVFLHPFVGDSIDRRYWNLACDMVTERAVAEVCGPRQDERGQQIAKALAMLEEGMEGRASAEKAYRALCDGAWADDVQTWEGLFHADDHDLWYAWQSVDVFEGGGADESTAEEDAWRKVAKTLAVDLRTYSKGRGDELQGLVDDLEETSRERTDYAEFLRQFATPGEVLKVSDDEFDYVFYTYGLRLYGNLPLVEPLEYREQKRVREFVVVIDTSGSVWGEAVHRFVDTTFDILKSTEAFFEQVHVRIIQSDVAVRADDVIRDLADLEEWSRSAQIHGGGGTDFRPAFAYVDQLVDEGAFENLGGLVYFTDGEGVFPDWMPAYRTAFVFHGNGFDRDAVPSWAAQIELDDALLVDA